MKKIVSLILVVALSCLMLAACTPATSEYSLAIAVDTSVSETGKVVNTAASLVIDKDGKIVSCRIDCAELTPTATDGVLNAVTSVTTKVEMGDSYDNGKMPAGNWAKQARAFADAVTGKTAEELEAFEPVSDALAQAGCTMQNTTVGYKATIIKAFGYAR